MPVPSPALSLPTCSVVWKRSPRDEYAVGWASPNCFCSWWGVVRALLLRRRSPLAAGGVPGHPSLGGFANWSIISPIASLPPAADCIPLVFAEQRGDALISGTCSREQPSHQKCSNHTTCRPSWARRSFSANS